MPKNAKTNANRTTTMSIEEAIEELRNAVHLASNSNDDVNKHRDRNDDVLNHDIQGSEGTNISSLSGSLPSDRSNALASLRKNLYAANSNHHEHNDSRHAWQMRRLHAAKRVENAVSNYELAVQTFHDGATSSRDNNRSESPADEAVAKNMHANDTVDLLVAVITSVPRNLFLQRTDSGGGKLRDSEQEDEYQASIEQVCYSAACIASDLIRKYFSSPALDMEHPPVLEDRHIDELIDEVVGICNKDSSANIDPIVRVLNFLSERRQIERCMYEREQGESSDEYWNRALFSCLPPKDTLQLIHTLMYRHLYDQEDEKAEASDLVGRFIGYLLEHFCNGVVMDTRTVEECTATDLFERWSYGLDEHMAQRLNDEEVSDVCDLVIRYHIGSIQITLQLIEDASLLISSATSESEKIDGMDGSILQNVLIALQRTIRHVTMVVTTTEVIDKLGLDHDREIHVIFNPLIVSYARFVASSFHDAILFVRDACASAHEGDELSILADDLLFRLCHVSVGYEFLQRSPTDTGEEDEVIAVALLRAVSSQCIAGKARFLVDIAADRVRHIDKGSMMLDSDEPAHKRQRALLGSTFRNGLMPPPSSVYKAAKLPPSVSHSEERREAMMDILIACLNFSLSDQDDEHADRMNLKQVSCVTSAIMHCQEGESGDENEKTVLDPLNPWHSLQVKSVNRLADFEADDSLLSYSQLTPQYFSTMSP